MRQTAHTPKETVSCKISIDWFKLKAAVEFQALDVDFGKFEGSVTDYFEASSNPDISIISGKGSSS